MMNQINKMFEEKKIDDILEVDEPRSTLNSFDEEKRTMTAKEIGIKIEPKSMIIKLDPTIKEEEDIDTKNLIEKRNKSLTEIKTSKSQQKTSKDIDSVFRSKLVDKRSIDKHSNTPHILKKKDLKKMDMDFKGKSGFQCLQKGHLFRGIYTKKIKEFDKINKNNPELALLIKQTKPEDFHYKDLKIKNFYNLDKSQKKTYTNYPSNRSLVLNKNNRNSSHSVKKGDKDNSYVVLNKGNTLISNHSVFNDRHGRSKNKDAKTSKSRIESKRLTSYSPQNKIASNRETVNYKTAEATNDLQNDKKSLNKVNPVIRISHEQIQGSRVKKFEEISKTSFKKSKVIIFGNNYEYSIREE